MLKNLHTYCPGSTGMILTTKFVLDAKVQNTVSWNISKLDLCGNPLALNMSLRSECIFWIIKTYIKLGQQIFSCNLRQICKTKQHIIFCGMLYI